MKLIPCNRLPEKLSGLEFTLAIGCRLHCRYCPQDLLVQKYTETFGRDMLQMSFETFQACLSKVNPGCGITIGGMVEPFQNPACGKMIRYAHTRGYKIALFTTLLGMRQEDLALLQDIPFTNLQLHIPDAEGNANFPVTKEYLHMLRQITAALPITAYSCHGTVHPSVQPLLKKEIVFGNQMTNRAGNLTYKELETYDRHGPLICGVGSLDEAGGWVPQVLPNGTLTLCCMDYGMQYVLGNLLQQDFNEIVRGETYLRFEQGMDDETCKTLCRACPTARLRSKSTRFLNLRLSNAIKIGRALERGQSVETDTKGVLRQLREAKTVCVFGLGKLFSDNYFQSAWHNVIQADLFCDNAPEKWGVKYNGIPCVSPAELKHCEDLLVVIYVQDSKEITRQLDAMQLRNHMHIFDLYDVFDEK